MIASSGGVDEYQSRTSWVLRFDTIGGRKQDCLCGSWGSGPHLDTSYGVLDIGQQCRRACTLHRLVQEAQCSSRPARNVRIASGLEETPGAMFTVGGQSRGPFEGARGAGIAAARARIPPDFLEGVGHGLIRSVDG